MNLIYSALGRFYEVYIVVVAATILLLEWYTQVHDRTSSGWLSLGSQTYFSSWLIV